MPEPERIFLSYARSDGKAFAADLRRQLESHHFSLFQDIVNLEGGQDWWQQIDETLHTVEFMVLVLTPAAIESKFVEKEWRLARQLGVCVVPVFGLPPNGLDLTRLRPWMRQAHIYNLDIPEQQTRFIEQLKRPCEVPRVPFMAYDLPADFVLRSREYDALKHALLDPRRHEPVPFNVALRGAGGYGKTTLANALCHDEEIQAEFHDGILWVTLGEHPRELTTKVADLIETLTGSRPGFQDVEAAAAKLSETLADRDCLLILDDVWSEPHARPFLRGGARCVRLITTRNADTLPRKCVQQDLDAMRESEAVKLLAYALPPDQLPRKRLLALARRLGEWPLLLKLANGALRKRIERGDSLENALDYIGRRLDKRGLTAFDAKSAEDRHQAAARTLGLSFEQLDAEERQRLGELAIFPEDVNVPLHLVAKLWDATGSLDEDETDELCARLFDLSLLLNLDLEKRAIRLHDTIRQVLREEAADRLPEWNTTFLDATRPRNANWWELPPNELFLYRHLPWHLSAAESQPELRDLLLEFSWLDAKLRATDINTLLADFLCAPEDDTLRLIEGALRLSAHVLMHDPEQLAYQLYGRLMGYREREEIARLLKSTEDGRPRPALWPMLPTLTQAGSPLLRTFTGHLRSVNAVAVTPDGRRAISASDDDTLKLWDLDTGEEIRTFTGHTGAVNAVAVASDARHAVSASSDSTLKLWDLDSGEEVRTLTGHSDSVWAVALTPDGHAVSASSDRTLKLWDLETGREVRTLSGHSDNVKTVALTRDGRRAVSGSYDEELKLWDLEGGEEIRTFVGHSSVVWAAALTLDGRRAVSASEGQTLKLWDVESGKTVGTLTGHSSPVKAVAITPDGHRAVSGSDDRLLKLWDLDSGEEVRSLAGHSLAVKAVALTPDGRRAVSASEDRTLKLWDLDSSEEVRTLTAHSSAVTAVALAPDGRRAVSAYFDQTLKLWDLGSSEEICILSGHSPDRQSREILAVAFTEGSRRAVSASSDGTIRFWNLESCEVARTLAGLATWFNAVAVTPDGHRALSALWHKTLKLWDLDTGEEVRTFAGHSADVTAVALTPDGRRAVSASSDGTLKLWELDIGEEVRTCAGHPDRVRAVALTPDGRRAVSASDDQTLKLWDLDTGAEVRTLVGHSAAVWGVALTSDGRRAVSLSGDQTLKLWELESGECQATFLAEGTPTCCAIAPNGLAIVAGDAGGRLYYLEIIDDQ